MNPMTATMPNMPNLHTVQMQNMAAAVGAMAGVSLRMKYYIFTKLLSLLFNRNFA
jgi:hypothetical protein